MKQIIIDFSNCTHWMDLHPLLKEKLDFPEYYGENLDALWDCLTWDLERPVTIAFKGIDRLTKELQQEALRIVQVFLDAEKELKDLHIILSQRL